MIEEQGLRPPFPDLARKETHELSPAKREKCFKVYAAYKALEKEYKQRGENVPANLCYSIVAEKLNISESTAKKYITTARNIKKKELSPKG